MLFPGTTAITNAIDTTIATTTTSSSPEAADDPIPPLLSLSNGFLVPRVGYSFYKTNRNVEQCTELALKAGFRHFDCASAYQNNDAVGTVLRQYIRTGVEDSTTNMLPSSTSSQRTTITPQQRRKELFITHKVSNDEQSTNIQQVKRAVLQEMKKLGVSYLDLCMLHSPLTDKDRRIQSYAALVELQKSGLVRSIGVCHFGVKALEELVNHHLPAPHVIQLQLSPFNQHADIANWARTHGSVLSCAAWSKLSSVDGPQDGWAVVAALAKSKSVTKAQILVRWALQSGYLCVPRSAATSKLERIAIRENSYAGVQDFSLTPSEMQTLKELEIGLPAGQLGVTDGYTAEDILSKQWDPTNL
jgi:diketogulonate reductase-like aldo/keto reductase